MNLIEFEEIYNRSGEMAAVLVIPDLDCPLIELLSKIPNMAYYSNSMGDEWCYVLIVKPEFSRYCDWTKLDGHHWTYLLHRQPQFHINCDWAKLDEYDWLNLLREYPQFSQYRK